MGTIDHDTGGPDPRPGSRTPLTLRQPGHRGVEFDRHGGLLSANEEARAWLPELPHEQDLPSDLGVGVPMWLLGTVFGALAVTRGGGDGTARSRVRTRRGTWLVVPRLPAVRCRRRPHRRGRRCR